MSRTYTKRSEAKPRKSLVKEQRDKRVILADYEIEFIEQNLGPNIKLSFY